MPRTAFAIDKAPRTTAVVLLLTGLVTALQLVIPGWLEALRRPPEALSSHEYWRFVTPILLNHGGWKEVATNFSGIAVVGTLVERTWGQRRWLIFYLVGGVTGECAGLAWRPYGAGSSVAICGLLGALAVWMMFRIQSLQARLGAGVLILGAVVLTWRHDLHGPPFLAAAVVASALLRRDTNVGV